VFRPVDQWANIYARHLSPRAIGLIVERRRLRAGLEPLSTHDWRRTFIGDLLDSGADLAMAQALAGHQSPTTTSLYHRRPERQRRDAIDRRRMPGGGC
jgi:integrase